jgi:hypothetical protein
MNEYVAVFAKDERRRIYFKTFFPKDVVITQQRVKFYVQFLELIEEVSLALVQSIEVNVLTAIK